MKIPHHIHMVGIGGIGMSALAQLLKHQGKDVCGSDREESPTTKLLHEKGIEVQIGHRAENISDDAELLVYSDAVAADSPERSAARERGIKQVSYFELLGAISASARDIAVAGTNGKTTTTGMLTAILKAAGKEPTAVIGSIVSDFGSNFVAGNDEVFVLEACEYRDHLLELHPEILVITNIELDHTDFFPSLAAVQNTFRAAAERVPADGVIVTNPNDETIAPILTKVKAKIVDYTLEDVPKLGLIGEFNAMNARAAKAAAMVAFADIDPNVADEALARFKGSWRRFEYKGETPSGAQVYDDYAHHPTAIHKTIEAARERFPGKRIVVAFHPHLYSRTKSFLNEFADSLATADFSIIAPIYAAREPLDETVSNHILSDLIRKKGGESAAIDSFDDIRDVLLNENKDTLVITMGAGDIYKVAEQITEE
jgi:UDP-N-acetylmuramate--alanine ligase